MNIVYTYLLYLCMAFQITASAQKNTMSAIEWKIAGELPALNGPQKVLGVAGAMTGMDHHVLLVAGGANFPDSMPWLGGQKRFYEEGYVFRKGENDTLLYLTTFHLPFPLAYTASCSTPEGIVAAGGENEHGLSKKVLLLQWNAAGESVLIKLLPDLPFAVSNTSLAVYGNKLYIAGGERAKDVSAELLTLDLMDIASGWKRLPSLPKAVSHAVLLVQSNGKDACLYLAGGRKRNAGSTSDLYSSLYQFNLTTGKWSTKKTLPYALSAGTGMSTGAHFLLLFGGDTGETFHQTEVLIAAINQATDEAIKEQLNRQKINRQANHPGFCRQVLLYNTKNDSWQPLGSIPFDVPVTTTAVQWAGNVIIPSGEIKAGVRTPQILAAKISEIVK